MSDLIEQLGGYEAAKRYTSLRSGADNESVCAALRNELLQYRRQHNIFEKGDWVVYEVTGCIGDFIDYIESPTGHCRVDFGLCDVGLILLKHLRHATDVEIKASKVLEVD